MNEYQVTIKKCEQTSPDDYELMSFSLKVTESTTIGQIQDWITGIYGTPNPEMKLDFRVVTLQTLPQ